MPEVDTASDVQRLVKEALEHINQGVTVFDGDLKLIAWNPRFIEMLEFPEELAFEGAEFAAFIRHNAERGEYGPGDVSAQVRARVAAALRFEPHRMERERPDGRVIEVIGSPLPGGGFVTTYTDVTQSRKRQAILESAVAERTAALSLSEARLRIIANEVPAGIAHMGADLTVQFTNRRFAHAYGCEPDDLLGRNAHEVLSRATMEVSAPFFEQAQRGRVVDFEMSLTLPDGRVKDIRTFLRPEREAEGDVIGFYLLSIDVTQQKLTTAAMLQAQKMDALGRLSSGIAHDFNNLLTIVIGNLTPLAERIDDPQLIETFLDPAINAARRGSNTTRRLMTVARRQPLQPSVLNVAEAIGGLVKLLRPSLPEDIEIVSTLPDPPPFAFVDSAQLEMALLNLAMNARDALPDGGRIAFSAERRTLPPGEAEALKLKAGDYVRIVIEDNGAGIRPELRARIFEPFFTTKSSTGGAGLGLSMVYGFLRQSNGSIWVESQPGEGARFVAYLPAAEDEEVVAEAEAPLETAGAGGGLVLLVEDNEDVRRVVRRQLMELGHPTVEAQDADEALRLLANLEEVYVLLTDYQMPGALSGLDLAERAVADDPEIRALLMTGQRVPAKNRFPVLRKPFEKADLARAIASATCDAASGRATSEAE